MGGLLSKMERQENIKKAQGPTPHFKVLQELGDSYVSVGNPSQAQQYYEKAAILFSDEAGPYIGLGVVALQKNLLDDAEIAFKVAGRLDPNCAKAPLGLAMVANQRLSHKIDKN